MDIMTKKGYKLLEVASALQKSIRRGKPKLAGYFALELFHSGYWKYVWKRLLTISAEDCYGIITKEIEALYNSFMLVNEFKPKKDKLKGRIFLTKAAILLALATKSRDADHLQNLVYDKEMITPEEIDEYLEDNPNLPIPDYAFDVHTKRGRKRGKTKRDFFKEENEALKPKTLSMFDDLVDRL